MRTTFEDRLLQELKHELELRAARVPAVAAVRAPGRRRVIARRAGWGLAACTAAAAVAVALPGSASTAAYAVEENGDGTVTFTINDAALTPQEQRDLTRELNAVGIAVLVENLPPGKECAYPRGEESGTGFVMIRGKGDAVVPSDGVPATDGTPVGEAGERRTGTSFEVSGGPAVRPGWEGGEPGRRVLRQGDTVTIENLRFPAGGGTEGARFYFYRGEVSPCEPVDSPTGGVVRR